ncbi:MAG: MBL fold metallo-hydrolase [Myxococcales bacterium]|nr:MBL fold metallo-hydrolase [Myxococcales bacterium]
MATIHHLNCCTMRPRPERLIHGEGSWLARGRMIAHVLLIETAEGLVAVDSGIGLEDCAHAKARLGATFVHVVGPTLDPEETLARQIEHLGFARRDLRHIVLTHLDVDHAGGISDFPDAQIHVYRAEHNAAMAPRGMERERYRPAHWAHGPRWALHDVDGERFDGFEAAVAIVEPEVILLPLTGHSRGHAAVAVATDEGWLIHAGDAYFDKEEMAPEPRCAPGLALFQRIVAVDDARRRKNQQRLRELKQRQPEIRIFSAHDQDELRAFEG